jgi:6-phosphogluconolactonase
MNSLAPHPAVEGLRRHAGKAAFVAAAAEDIARRLGEAIDQRGSALMALAGGKTPEPVYRKLATLTLPWAEVTATLTDERFVPPTSELSNAGFLARALFTGAARASTFIPLWSEAASAGTAADAADQRLASLGDPFDLVVLGMGDDGHTASLFPQTPELATGLDPASPRKVIAVAPHAPAPKEPRLSLTLAALLNARAILILITGETKLQVLKTALAGEDAHAMPIRAVLHQSRVPVVIHWSPEA